MMPASSGGIPPPPPTGAATKGAPPPPPSVGNAYPTQQYAAPGFNDPSGIGSYASPEAVMGQFAALSMVRDSML